MRLYRIAPLLLFIFLWELIVRRDRQLVFFFGLPSKIASYLGGKTLDGSLPVDFSVTFVEAVIGFIAGNVLGTIVGLSLWYSKTAFSIAKPYIIVLGSAPVFALAPILVIWFGTGLFCKVMIAALSTFFIALSQAYIGASEVSSDYLRLMQSFGATKSQTFRKVIAPSSLVWVISAFRINVGFALLGAFIGEFISSEKGLGHLILVAGGLTDMSLVLCGVLMLSCIALFLTYAVSKLELPLKQFIVKYL
jgi:NitT/TauT family transport system permease protein